MIVVRIIGGLGNQLFQYALARCISEKWHIPYKLDVSTFDFYKLHAYSLQHFNIQEQIASEEDLSRYYFYMSKKPLARLYKLSDMLKPYNKRTVVYQKGNDFDENILRINHSCYLHGFWQSALFFKDIEHIIRDEVVVKTAPQGRDVELIQQMKKTESVSLHVRRTDYLTGNYAEEFKSMCSLEYYRKAIEMIKQKCDNPVFFVFSDDKEWVKEHIKTDCETIYVDHNQADKNFEDIRLISSCKHHIIANSSFSWWGAWLNKDHQKTVIAPKAWFRLDPALDSPHIVPSSWIRPAY